MVIKSSRIEPDVQQNARQQDEEIDAEQKCQGTCQNDEEANAELDQKSGVVTCDPGSSAVVLATTVFAMRSLFLVLTLAHKNSCQSL